MTYTEMRLALNKRYPGWIRKLEYMPGAQILAIYMRVFGAKKPAPPRALPPAKEYYVYMCNSCLATYETDNPCETECRVCGSQGLLKYDKKGCYTSWKS